MRFLSFSALFSPRRQARRASSGATVTDETYTIHEDTCLTVSTPSISLVDFPVTFAESDAVSVEPLAVSRVPLAP